MWFAIKAFFSANVAKLAEIGAALGVIAGAYAAIFSAGKKSEKTAELQETLKTVEEAHAIENKNSALSDADVDNQLHIDWSK